MEIFEKGILLLGMVCIINAQFEGEREFGRQKTIEEINQNVSPDDVERTLLNSGSFNPNEINEAKGLLACIRTRMSPRAIGNHRVNSILIGDVIMNLSQLREEGLKFSCGTAISPQRKKRQVKKLNEFWPNGEVSYRFSHTFPNRMQRIVKNALSSIEDQIRCSNGRPAVTFREVGRTREPHVVVTSDNSGCWSFLGQQDGVQALNLQNLPFDNCITPGIIQHEFFHALGIMHQHQRSDRDDFVTINMQNLDPVDQIQFEKCTREFCRRNVTPYDYTSIMHYGNMAYSKNRLETITPKNRRGHVIGRGYQISHSDQELLKDMYCSQDTSSKEKERKELEKSYICYQSLEKENITTLSFLTCDNRNNEVCIHESCLYSSKQNPDCYACYRCISGNCEYVRKPELTYERTRNSRQCSSWASHCSDLCECRNSGICVNDQCVNAQLKNCNSGTGTYCPGVLSNCCYGTQQCVLGACKRAVFSSSGRTSGRQSTIPPWTHITPQPQWAQWSNVIPPTQWTHWGHVAPPTITVWTGWGHVHPPYWG